jgi:hypothetical protein
MTHIHWIMRRGWRKLNLGKQQSAKTACTHFYFFSPMQSTPWSFEDGYEAAIWEAKQILTKVKVGILLRELLKDSDKNLERLQLGSEKARYRSIVTWAEMDTNNYNKMQTEAWQHSVNGIERDSQEYLWPADQSASRCWRSARGHLANRHWWRNIWRLSRFFATRILDQTLPRLLG